ncbi:Branched-chain amino acid ABC transporter permease protein [uncultured spirochete]|jgi:branched-chain amino acid transport system permease protein|uniref:Branched-chain amino acid ABC transporter permease protein n=2 Tax=Spirochaetales TaxID=136 RepID=A0A3P3XL56_9SPIR|nr:Branched-chain amino acid ABC transporter permease protein [uncultured spirochete]
MNVRKLPRFLIAVVLFYIVVEVLYRTEILNGYLLHIINLSLIYVILATSLNLINGITGQFSLGHMGFAAVGAYVSGSLTTLILKLSVTDPASMLPFILSIIAGGVVAAFVGFLIGFPSLRLKGDYLAIVTLGFGEIIRTIFNNIDAVGGPRGLLGIPKFSNFTVILVATFLTVVIIRNLIESSHGRAMLSIRENELAAELVGINTTRYKVMAFTFGAFFAGIAGGLLAHLIQLAHPTQFGFIKSVEVLIMIYAGGVGSLTGSILAAFGLTFLSEGLRLGIRALADATGLPIGGEWRMVVYALLLIFIMLFRNEGLMGMRESRIIKNVEVD